LSINQLLPSTPPLGCASGAGGGAAAAGLDAAAAPAAGDSPGAPGLIAAGAPGLVTAAAGLVTAAAPGLVTAGAPGAAAAGAPAAGDVCGAAGACASKVSARDSDDRQTMSEVFIIETVVDE
jgi:hypothetical protein